jgi:hypothetical protein
MENTGKVLGDDKPGGVRKLETIFISNIAEVYYKTYYNLPDKERKAHIEYDLIEAERALVCLGDNKAVVVSKRPDKHYIDDLCQRIGYHNLVVLSPARSTEKLNTDILEEPGLLKKVTQIVKENPGIKIVPYYPTDDFFDLLAHLRQKNLQFETPETVYRENRFIHHHHNSKVGFRTLWDKAVDADCPIKIPQGFIVDDLEEAITAARWFYYKKKDFIFKYNRGSSGVGVVFYHYKDLPKEEEAFKEYFTAQHQDRIWFEENFVVEEAIVRDESFFGGTPSIEFKINGKVQFMYICAQWINKATFEGIYLGKELLDPQNLAIDDLIKEGTRFGEALKELGYRGIYDVDTVIDKNRQLYAVESNMRRTGGTHVYELGRYLYGSKFIDKISLMSRENLPVKKSIDTYQKLFKIIEPILFQKEKYYGVIVVQPDSVSIGQLGYIAIAPDKEKLFELNEKLKSLVCP